MKYFDNLMKAMTQYKSNALHESKRKVGIPVGYGLCILYEIIFVRPLINAHNAIVDSRAQSKIFMHSQIQSHFNKLPVVELIEEVWRGKQK